MFNNKRKQIFPIVVTGALFFFGSLTTYGWFYYFAPGPLSQPATLVFKRGEGFREIVDDMAEQGVIRHVWLFTLFAVLNGEARQFKAGEYNFSAAISPRLIMDMIAHGRVVIHKVTVPEGLTVAEIKTMLDSEKILEGDVPQGLKEGSLLPQTYQFVYGDSRKDVIARMQAAMTTTIAELWETRKEGLPLKSPQEALTLASIVEKETGVVDERGRVASVFVNRLRKGMRLQTDPTVIYAVTKGQGPLGRPLAGSDLAIDSPYNTYRVVGLPPGPIANPGRLAIEATLNPPDTDDLYFVATGTGGHNFSSTIGGHNANVKQYRKVLKQKK